MRTILRHHAGLFAAPAHLQRRKNLFSAPPAPVLSAPPPMPDPLDPANMAAQRLAAAKAAGSGRSSTTLTTPSGAAGTIAGGAYTGAKLSGAA
jgi:hypothetical protein